MNFFSILPHELLKRIYYYVPDYMDLILYHIAPFREFCRESVAEGFARARLMEYIALNESSADPIMREWFFSSRNFTNLGTFPKSDCYFAIAAGCKKLVNTLKLFLRDKSKIVIIAAQHGRIDIFRENFVDYIQYSVAEKCLSEAVKNNHLHIVEVIHEIYKNSIPTRNLWHTCTSEYAYCAIFAAINGNFEMISYLFSNINRNYWATDNALQRILMFSMKYHNLDIAHYICDNYIDDLFLYMNEIYAPNVNDIFVRACRCGDFYIFMKLHQLYAQHICDYNSLLVACAKAPAARGLGAFRIFIRLITHNTIGDAILVQCAEHAARGNIYILIYLHALGVKFNSKIFTQGIASGDIEIIKFLMNIDCPQDVGAIIQAARSYYCDIIEFLLSRGAKHTSISQRYLAKWDSITF